MFSVGNYRVKTNIISLFHKEILRIKKKITSKPITMKVIDFKYVVNFRIPLVNFLLII